MKVISPLFFVILSCFFQNDLTSKEIQKKADKIRIELLNSKQLPSSIQSWGKIPFRGYYKYTYNTARWENNIIDSVYMMVDIMNEGDFLGHISFNEMHFKKGKEDISYTYAVNKYGVIDWAYRTEPPKVQPDKTHMKKGSVVYSTTGQPIMEINTDSLVHDIPYKKPDEKTRAIYNARLKTTLDELDKILFAK